MPNINPVDLQTLGARVTDPAQLTEGRWYAVRVNCIATHNPLVHAQYLGNVGHTHEFLVAADDYKALSRSLGLARQIYRESNSIRTGKTGDGAVCEVFKFKQVVANQSNASEPTATLSTVDQFKSEIDALRAKVQQKRDQMGKLAKEVVEFTQVIEDTREKLRASLDGYI